MKPQILLSMLILAVFAACEKSSDESGSCTLKASAVQECIMTKTSFNTVNGKFAWQEDDVLGVCCSSSGKFKPFTLADTCGVSFATFSGKASRSAIRDCAVYPYSLSPRVENGELKVTLPSFFSYEGAAAKLPMYASAEDLEQYDILYFKQMGAILGLKLPENLSSETAYAVLSAPGHKLCGEFIVRRDSCTACIETAEGEEDCLEAVFDVNPASAYGRLNFPVPAGDFGQVCLTALSAARETLSFFRTNEDVSLVRGEIAFKTLSAGSSKERYCTRVSADRTSWVGDYMIVYENGMEAVVMYTGAGFSDLNCQGICVPLTENGFLYGEDLENCRLTVINHKADASGVGPSVNQGGKYSILLPSGVGIGRYARTTFAFNNNVDYGRFVNSISYDSAAGAISISCPMKNEEDTFLRYDTASSRFGYASSTELGSGSYANVQFYEYPKDN